LTTFAPIFAPAALREAVSDGAWLAAMLDVERALANAESLAGVVPAPAAAAISECCAPELYDIAELCEQGRASGTPVEPLVRALRARTGDDAAPYVHFGATSQDVLDSASMLVARSACELIDEELAALAGVCARLAEEYRSTPLAARTLLQQAVATTFGAKTAGWLVAVVEARARLSDVRFTAELGGAAGTLAPLGGQGIEVLRLFARELELEEPVVPWHAHRGRVAELAAALDAVGHACGKIGLDVVLLAQTEVGEVAEAEGGVSTAMPHKRNPTRAIRSRTCARLAHAHAGVLTGGEYEHERAAGHWQAEWSALSDLLALSGGAANAARECLEGLQVDTGRMRANMSSDLDAGDVGSAEAFVDRALARYRETV
jgi:3-carboxy-cis,cis-muconate cycloisomerase